ncbi:MAG: hypothetical protein NE327_16885, partial [Lentisphaeraceae bacterium]|nr:hypothetical protein [Lentisphaeraceae bacterium]
MKLIKILPFFFFLFSLSAENILFIGGSYTEEIKSTLTQLLQKENTGTRVQFISPAGKDLKFHINNVNTMKVINNGDWDKIVLQED